MSEWQDISTAPKDGTRVLVGCFGRVAVSCKHRLGTMQVDYWHNREEAGFEGFGKFNADMWPATHWQPLPTPPHTGKE